MPTINTMIFQFAGAARTGARGGYTSGTQAGTGRGTRARGGENRQFARRGQAAARQTEAQAQTGSLRRRVEKRRGTGTETPDARARRRARDHSPRHRPGHTTPGPGPPPLGGSGNNSHWLPHPPAPAGCGRGPGTCGAADAHPAASREACRSSATSPAWVAPTLRGAGVRPVRPGSFAALWTGEGRGFMPRPARRGGWV